MQERIPLVIDTDMAYGSPQADIDDAVALLFALASPEFDLLAVSAAGGNAAPGCVSRNLDSLLRLVSADIPHSFSCSRPIDPGFWVNARWSSSPAKPAARSEYPDLPDSVQLLYSTLSASAEPVTLVTIGPMTTTALLLIQHPDSAGTVGRIVSMGGSIHMDGVAGGPAEFNIKADPEAAAAVFSSGIPVFLFPLDVTKKKRIYPETIASWEGRGPLIRSLREASVAFMKHRAERDGYYPPYAFFHDVLPLAYLADPSLFTMRECSVSVDLHGDLTRGVTVFDMASSGAHVAVDVDSDRVLALAEGRIMERFGTL